MRKSRYETDHARYLRKREEILEKQRIYRRQPSRANSREFGRVLA